jgi:hypothetical protein
MASDVSRRELVGLGAAAGVLLGWQESGVQASPPEATPAKLWPGFPRQDSKLVAAVVGAAHRDLARVKELVTAHPPLVNAWWDWGFGDWESPLGAASHVGRREIAEFLLDQGARIDVFAAAMLGMTDVLKAFVAARPGIQKTLGPHGIPLLSHAKAGGDKAKDAVAYLESLGDAGTGTKVATLPADRKASYFGKFASKEADVRLECRVNMSGMLVLDVQVGNAEATARNLNFLGEDEFFPSGVPSVRIRFSMEGGKASAVAIRANEHILTAVRIGG